METPKFAEFICLSLYLTCEFWTSLASNLAMCLCFVVETLGFTPATFLPGPESCWKCICCLWVMTLLMNCRSFSSYDELNNEAEFFISIVTSKKNESDIVQSNFFIKADRNSICGENLCLITSL